MSVTDRCDVDAESVCKELEELEQALPVELAVIDVFAKARKKELRAEFIERRRRLRRLLAVLQHEAGADPQPKEEETE